MNKLTTLCYIEKDNKYLMLHRIKKENDINHDKWIGVGGNHHICPWGRHGVIHVTFYGRWIRGNTDRLQRRCAGMGRERPDFGAELVGRGSYLFPLAGRTRGVLFVEAYI